ncbi:PREDICTED: PLASMODESMATA CALLOSE-BINDING PROTEIN 5 [Prunus mume]|uniref:PLASMODESMATA CALLOSE-BINDING PROTEIN 5 n=1 Tax=Prunus mume TaxID=102107 RepID=A0ABM0NSE9_PRUMU|nr:PREDICTED: PLASMODESMATA CALLOSE-BINDING PROTEIN 5 [Prunus mume]
MTDESCNFDNTAALTSLNPSYNKCKFPSSLSSSNASLSSPSTAYGMGSSEDLNGNNQISQLWIWHLMTSLLLIAFSWVMG